MQDNLNVLNAIYGKSPESFSQEEVDTLQQTNQSFGINFQRNQDAGDFNLANTVTNLFDGFVQGFTTLDPGIGTEPTNTTESIARSLGHLLGFIGIIPGVGTAGSLVSKVVGKTAFSGLKLAGISEAGKIGLGLTKGLNATAKFKSIPMMVADGLTEYAGLNKISSTVGRYLGKSISERGGLIAGSMLKGGIHLGTASAVSSWQEGTDQMMESFGSGFVAGGVFRGMGELLPSKIVPDNTKGLFKMFGEQITDPKGFARILSSTMFMGLPATLEDQPVELQVYNYLLGAYFGGTEMPEIQRTALNEMHRLPYKSLQKMPQMSPRWVEIGKMENGKAIQEEMIRQANLSNAKAFDIIYKSGDKFEKEFVGEGGVNMLVAINEIRDEKIAKLNEIKDTLTGTEYKKRLDKIGEEHLNKYMFNEYQKLLGEELDRNAGKIKAGEITETEVLSNYEEKAADKVREMLGEEFSKAIALNSEMVAYNAEEARQKWIHDNKDSSEAGKYLSKFEELMKQDMENVSMQYREPIEQIAESFVRDLEAKDMLPKDKTIPVLDYEIKRNIHSIISKNKDAKDGFQKMVDEISETYKVDLKQDPANQNKLESQLRLAYMNKTSFSMIPAKILDISNGKFNLWEYNTSDITGKKWVEQSKDNPFLQEILSPYFKDGEMFYGNIKSLRRVKRVYDENLRGMTEAKDKQGRKILEDVDLYKLPAEEMDALIKRLDQEGLNVFAGAKDNSNLIYYKYMITDPVEIKAQMDLMELTAKELGLEKLYKEYLVDASKSFYKKDKKTGNAIISAEENTRWAKSFVNNWKVLESLNKMSAKELLQAITTEKIKDGFLTDPTKLNKRISLMDNGFQHVTADYMPADAKAGLKTAIIKGINKSDRTLVKGKKDIEFYRITDGILEAYRTETHTDGVVYLRDDIFDAMALSSGLTVNVGAHKGSLTYSDDNGMLLGKYAYHRAGKEMSAELKAKGLHVILNDTSAKAYGKRKVYESQWDPTAKEGERWKFFEGANEVTNEGVITLSLKNEINPTATNYNILSNGKIIGNVIVSKKWNNQIQKETEEIEIDNIHVDKDKQNQGIASTIYRKLVPNLYPDKILTSLKAAHLSKSITQIWDKLVAEGAATVESTGTQTNNRYKMTAKGGIISNAELKKLGEDNILRRFEENGFESLTDMEQGMLKEIAARPNPNAVESYLLPHKSFTTTNAGEHEAHGSLRYASQLFSTMDSVRFPKGIKWANKLMNDAYFGDVETNKIVDSYINGDKTIDISKVDVDKISAQKKLDVLFSGEETPLYKKILSHYIKSLRDRDSLDEDVDSYVDYKTTATSAERLFKLWSDGEGSVSPSLLKTSALAPYFNKLVSNAVLKELTKPIAKGAFIAVFAPYRPDLMGSIEVRPGEMLIADGKKNQEISFLGEKVKLVDAVEKWKAEKDPMVKLRMEDDLTLPIQRTPTDSVSGIRMARVIGFSNIPGATAVLHPKDMINAGGADLDIDKGFIYLDMPNEVKLEYKATQNEWYDYYDAKDLGKKNPKPINKKKLTWQQLDAKVKSGEFVEVFKEATDSKDFIANLPKRLERLYKNPFAMGDNRVMAGVNRSAWTGKELLGQNLNLTRQILADLDSDISLGHRKAGAIEKLMEYKRALVNLSADAANGIPLKTGKEIEKILVDAAYKQIEHPEQPADRTDKVAMEKYIKEITSVKKSNEQITSELKSRMKNLSDLNAYSKGKYYGEPLQFQQIVNGIKELSPKIQGLRNPSYTGATNVGKLDIDNFVPFNHLGDQFTPHINQMSIAFGSNVNAMGINGRKYEVSGTPDSEKGVYIPANDVRHRDFYQKGIQTDPFGTKMKAEQLVGQDISDLTSFEYSYLQTPINKDGKYDWTLIGSIRTKVWAIKDKMRTMLEMDDATRGDSTADKKNEIMLEYADYKESIVKQFGEKWGKFADAMALSSIRPQETDALGEVKSYKQWKSDRLNEIREKIERTNDKDEIAELKKLMNLSEKEVQKIWKTTNFDTFPTEWLTVSDTSIREWGMKYNEIAQRVSKAELSESDLNIIKDFVADDMVTPDVRVPNVPKTVDETTRELAFRSEAELKKAGKEVSYQHFEWDKQILKKYFGEHPEELSTFEAIAVGENYRQKFGTTFQGGLLPKLWSGEEVHNFALTLDAIMKYKGKGRRLTIRDYFADPKNISRRLVAQDATLYREKIPVLTSPNTMEIREARVFRSRFEQNVNLSTAKDEAIDGMDSALEEKMNNRVSFRILKALNEIQEGLGSQLLTIVAYDREKNKGSQEVPVTGSEKREYKFARVSENGYEVSSRGDERFSALTAKLSDGRTIEEAYQLDVKGYRAKGNDWKLGKGKAPLTPMTKEESWTAYKKLWEQWATENPKLITELSELAKGKVLTDQFARTEISQARALAEILSAKNYKTLSFERRPIIVDGMPDIYAENGKKAKEMLDKIAAEDLEYKIPFLGRKIKIEEAFKLMNDDLTNWARENDQTFIQNDKAINTFLSKYKIMNEYGYWDMSKLAKVLSREMLSGKPELKSIHFLDMIHHQQKLQNLSLDAIERLRQWDADPTTGEIPKYKSYKDVVEKSPNYKKWLEGKFAGITTEQESFMRHIRRLDTDPYYLQDNGERMKAIFMHPKDQANFFNAMKNRKDFRTGKPKYPWMRIYDYKFSAPRDEAHKTYFPHSDYESSTVKAWTIKTIENAKLKGETNNQIRHKTLESNYEVESSTLEANRAFDFDQFFSDKSTVVGDVNDIQPVAGSLQARSKANPTPGWSTDAKTLLNYERKLAKTYYTAMNAFLTQRNIFEFKTGEWDNATKKYVTTMGDQTTPWSNFMQIYVANVSGRPSLIPKQWIEDKNMALQNNPYMLLTNEYWKPKTEAMAKKYFDKHPLYKDLPALTEKEWKSLDDNAKEKIKSLSSFEFDRKVNWISGLDAKWNLISLLTHTKTMVVNLVGGNTNTIASGSLRHWMKSGDLNYLKENVFTEAKSWEDIVGFIEKNGGIESMFKNEFGLSSTFNQGKFKDFAKDVMTSMKKGEQYSEDKIRAKARMHNLQDSIFETAGWFMRKSEVMLRSKSWLTHYLQAKEVLNVNGLDVEADHPWLISMANKGVSATQFLYNNANRPAFARTALGKIFSRFQLFAWKSVGFRTDAYRLARDNGFKEGTPEFDRFRRLMTADIFVMALAAVLPASLFESALPPPMTWLQDLSEFFFGDSKEKDRAFYGTLPYPASIMQMVSPPSARVLYNTVNFAISGDIEKMGSDMMTWLPGGRLVKSGYRTYQSPAMAVENFIGLPIHKINAMKNKIEKGKGSQAPGISLF